MRHLFVKDLLSQLNFKSTVLKQRSADHLEWVGSNIIGFVNEFVRENGLSGSYFIKGMNSAFDTGRFELFLKKWIVEYLEKLFRVLDDPKKLVLEDNPLNRFGVAKYRGRFITTPEIKWERQPGLPQRICSILARPLIILRISLNKGIRLYGRKKRYKVMREAIWGLYGTGGYYFHDDFMVDGDKIKKEDLLLFSREISTESGRLKGYHDAKKSPYGHFNLSELSIGLGPLALRVIPRYIVKSGMAICREIDSRQFSLYWSVYLSFKYNALPYEKVFSHFEIGADLGHNSFASGHVAEAVVCRHYGTKYFLMNWSDDSITINSYLMYFMGCDGYLVWGRAHTAAFDIDPRAVVQTGYIFKRHIKGIMADKDRILAEMGVGTRGKVITFFDESFGSGVKMTEGHFLNFWEAALELSEAQEGATVLMKPKALAAHHNLSDDLKKRFITIKDKMAKRPNIHIIDDNKWSFIECVGVSDVVVTQGMTTSATIAIMCGIEGLYLDEAGYSHPFSDRFKDRVVFDDHKKLIAMIGRIIRDGESPLKDIPEKMLRDYDTYEDDMGMDRFRNGLLLKNVREGRYAYDRAH